jgi:phage FluMu protein Com
MAINIIEARCPRCAGIIELTITATPQLTQTQPGRKGFITALVTSSGVEHTCPDPRET